MFVTRDPAILESVHFDDMSGYSLETPENFMISDGRNTALFEYSTDGGYFGHCWFVDRGRSAIDIGKKVIQTFFEYIDQPFLRGFTPMENKSARWAMRQMGFKSFGTFKNSFGEFELFIIIRNDWIN